MTLGTTECGHQDRRVGPFPSYLTASVLPLTLSQPATG